MLVRLSSIYDKLCAAFIVICSVYMILWFLAFTNRHVIKSDSKRNQDNVECSKVIADNKKLLSRLFELESKILKNNSPKYVIKLPKWTPLYKTINKTADGAGLPAAKYFNVPMKTKKLNCRAIFDGEIDVNYNKDNWDTKNRRAMYRTLTKDCSTFQMQRGYIMSSLTKEEQLFPIAFSIMTYKDVEQTERLLRVIYRPQNYYCIHVDAKSNDSVHKAMQDIAACFENVFVLNERVDVTWGTMSVLEQDLLCMSSLWHYAKNWKYFINLTGQEFPLRTNYELVRILTEFRGASDVDGSLVRANTRRWKNASTTPPHNLSPVKGSVHVALSRTFVDFVLHDARAWDLLRWLNGTNVPDETFFSTLNHNPSLGITGSYGGLEDLEKTYVKPTVVRYKSWPTGPYSYPCRGKRVRSVCVFGTGDLRALEGRRELFANKFYRGYQHAFDCMEELIFNRTREEYYGLLDFNSTWYSKLEFVVNRKL